VRWSGTFEPATSATLPSHLGGVLSRRFRPVTRRADALEVVERPRVSALAERSGVVDLLGGPLVTDLAERIAGEDCSTGGLPPLLLENPFVASRRRVLRSRSYLRMCVSHLALRGRAGFGHRGSLQADTGSCLDLLDVIAGDLTD
jgi:hypothetical protein